MSRQNKAVIRRGIEEVYNQGKLDVVDELVSSDFVAHLTSGDVHGPEGMKQFAASLREAFPDLQVTVEDQFEDGDKVVTRWTARGTHTGTFNGIPPTGRQGTVTAIDIDRFVDGKAVECWSNTDDLGLLQQLGVVPAPGETPAATN